MKGLAIACILLAAGAAAAQDAGFHLVLVAKHE